MIYFILGFITGLIFTLAMLGIGFWYLRGVALRTEQRNIEPRVRYE